MHNTIPHPPPIPHHPNTPLLRPYPDMSKRPSLTQRLQHARVAALNEKSQTKRSQSFAHKNSTSSKDPERSRKPSWMGSTRHRSVRTSSGASSASRGKDTIVVVNGTECTKSELDEYKQLFSMFDTDGSGAIGNDELKQAMMSIGIQSNDQEIDNLIREIDEDGNGEIDFAEFCTCMKKSQSLVKASNEEVARQCFDTFDQDGNGVITQSEFKYVAKEIGGFDDELAELVFNELDISSNGHLTSEQFAAIVDDYLLSHNEDGDSTQHKPPQTQDDAISVVSYCGSIADVQHI